jgi:hypothetical protein
MVQGPANMCTIKGDDFISPSRDVLVASASMIPEPAAESHGYSDPLDQWAVCRFLSGKDNLRPLLMVKIRQPSHEFTFGVGISFIPYPLVLTPVV